MHGIPYDVRFAARQFRKRPGFALIAVLTFAIGIGATTTFFSILNAFVLRPLPYPDADGLVLVHGVDLDRGGRRTGVSFQDFTELREQTPALGSAAAYAEHAFNLAGGGGEPERVRVGVVTAGFFDVLGIPPVQGRGFLAEEDRPGGDRVVVLGHRLWAARFGNDPSVVGRVVMLDGEPHTVVGLAAERFDYPSGVALWRPLAATPAGDGAERSLQMIARLAQGATRAHAEQQLQVASRSLGDSDITGQSGWLATATPLRTSVGTKFGGAAIALLSAAGFVLLIACGNLANLQLAMMSARRQEISVRAALGAGRGRIARLLFTEGVMLSVAGGVIGLAIAQLGVTVFLTAMGAPEGISASELEIALDYRVLLFAFALAVAAGLTSSFSAAMRSSRVDLREAMQGDARGGGAGIRTQRLRRWLVGAQIALSLPLVIGASSVMLSSFSIQQFHPGFEPEGIVASRVALTGDQYDTAGERVALVEQILPRLQAIPQVETVAAASHVPLINRNDVPWVPFEPEGWDPGAIELPSTSVRHIAEGYHAAMGIPMIRGRSLSADEARAATPSAIVINQTMASRFWPDGDPIGRRIRLGSAEGDGWLVVVGVAGDVMQRGLPAAPENQVYLPYAQSQNLTLVVRSTAAPGIVIPEIRAAIRGVDPSLPVYDVRTMDDAYRWFFRDRASQGAVLGSLGVVALLLALLGVYGVMAFSVAQRTREFGIRMALGSQPIDVLRAVLRSTLVLIGAGTALGLLLSLAVTRGLAAIFPAVPQFQPFLFVAVASLIAFTVLLASYLPARRAAAVNPMVAMRAE